MPALVSRNATEASTNATTLHVICEFPLSGQYGLGSRLLYYALVVACVVGRTNEVIKKACLAAALVFPAVAAFHGIVLAALHRDGVVDMDIYGAFQLCAIGILAAPVTVKLSSTYFSDPRRNIIFAWTILLLTGLLSLTAEFSRSGTTSCPYDDFGQPLSPDPSLFDYNNPPTCNLTCSTTSGPFSPIRQGSANNIYVVPAPARITFGTGTILGAACCIPAVLHLISMRYKIRRVQWYAVFGAKNKGKAVESEGKDNATFTIKKFPVVPEALVFGLVVAFILVLGEINFFTPEVSWQTEPMSAIGQWASILGTVLAVVGLLYHLTYGKNKSSASPNDGATEAATNEGPSLSNSGGRTSTSGVVSLSRPVTPTGGISPPERVSTMKSLKQVMTLGDIGKQKIARTFSAFTAPTADQYGDNDYSSRLAYYPASPGQSFRDPNFNKTEHQWIGKIREHSRAPSAAGSARSGLGRNVEVNTPSRGESPRRSQSGASPGERASGELQNVTSHRSGSDGEMLQLQPTLTVPSVDHRGRMPYRSTPSITSDESIGQGPSSPISVIISRDLQEPDPDVPEGT